MEQHLGFPLETIAIFVAVVAFSVWLDLRLHKDSEDISIPNAVAWSLFWICLAIGFYFYLKIHHSPEFADGKQAFKDGVTGFLKAYPDSSAVIKHIGADGDLVFIHNHIKLIEPLPLIEAGDS